MNPILYRIKGLHPGAMVYQTPMNILVGVDGCGGVMRRLSESSKSHTDESRGTNSLSQGNKVHVPPYFYI